MLSDFLQNNPVPNPTPSPPRPMLGILGIEADELASGRWCQSGEEDDEAPVG